MVDIDGCLGDFNQLMANYVGLKDMPDPDHSNYWEATVWKDYFTNSQIYWRSYVHLVADGQYLNEQITDSCSIDVVNALHNEGNEIIIATDRRFSFLVDTNMEWINRRAEKDTATWLNKIGLKYSQLLLTPHKSDANADVYIEDSPTNITEIIQSGAKHTVLISHAYNRNTPNVSLDSNNWQEIYTFIKTLNR